MAVGLTKGVFSGRVRTVIKRRKNRGESLVWFRVRCFLLLRAFFLMVASFVDVSRVLSWIGDVLTIALCVESVTHEICLPLVIYVEAYPGC